MKHTPGPWEADIDNNGDYIVTIRSYRRVYVNATYEDDDNVKHDAHLIAAAPDMYEALKNLENDNNQIPDLAWQMVQDAIAKAEGRGEGE